MVCSWAGQLPDPAGALQGMGSREHRQPALCEDEVGTISICSQREMAQHLLAQLPEAFLVPPGFSSCCCYTAQSWTICVSSRLCSSTSVLTLRQTHFFLKNWFSMPGNKCSSISSSLSGLIANLHFSLAFYLRLGVFHVIFLYREECAGIECAEPTCSASTNPSNSVLYTVYTEFITPLI